MIGVEQHHTKEAEDFFGHILISCSQMWEDLHHSLFRVVVVLNLVNDLQYSEVKQRINRITCFAHSKFSFNLRKQNKLNVTANKKVFFSSFLNVLHLTIEGTAED